MKLPGLASVNMDLKVLAGIVAWFLSGPLYMPIMILVCITPTTRNVDWLIRTVLPVTSSRPKRSLASSSPRKTTLRFSLMSGSFRKRPPAWGIRFRSSPNSGSTPRTRAFTVLVPAVRPIRRLYSQERAWISGTRTRRRFTSSSVNWMGRPEGRPMNAFVVAPVHTTPIPSPMPREPLWNERFIPSPKESSSTMESVPHAMARMVRAMRFR